MASAVRELVDSYHESINHADPRTKDWFLVWSDYSYVLSLTILYLLFLWIGPRIMAKRKPMELTSVVVFYNLGLVALSGYMVIEIILSAWEANYGITCQPYDVKVTPKDPKELRVAKVMWWYFFSKAIEFMDTVLMVLRKKNRQITFLHVFHHASMLNIWWFVMMYIPGGLSYFGALMNCVIHTVMYTYYGFATLPSMQPYLWWKKYLTKMQLTQFVITFSHSVYTIVNGCDFPQWGKYLLVGYMVCMLVLFGNFYVQTYRHSKHLRHTRRPDADTCNNYVLSNSVHNGFANGLNGVTNGKVHGYVHERKAD